MNKSEFSKTDIMIEVSYISFSIIYINKKLYIYYGYKSRVILDVCCWYAIAMPTIPDRPFIKRSYDRNFYLE